MEMEILEFGREGLVVAFVEKTAVIAERLYAPISQVIGQLVEWVNE